VPYSTQADVQQACGGLKRFKQAFDWDNDGAVDASAIDSCIAEADALIDSFASKRFSVPFNPVPPIIASMSARLAILISARRRGPLTDDQLREFNSIAGTETGNEGWLYRLATGVVTPGGDPLPPAHTTMQNDGVETSMPSDRDASRDKLGGFW
jgi:phage gp36-like protein